MPFTDFATQNTHDNYEIYFKIMNNNYSCEDIDYFLDKNIKYYYQASRGLYGGQISPLKGNPNFKLNYSVGTARLFEMIPCNN